MVILQLIIKEKVSRVRENRGWFRIEKHYQKKQ